MGVHRDIAVIGGSAGSLDVLKTIVRDLPADHPGTIFAVIHQPARGGHYVSDIIARCSLLPVIPAKKDQRVEAGKIYMAAPDCHLVVGRGHIHVTRSPKEGLHRPSINVTFRSAAAAYRDRVVGVLLSGMLDDGASGLWEIARNSGVTVIQDLTEAEFPSMPLSAFQDAPVNFQLRAAEIGPKLAQLAAGIDDSDERKSAERADASQRFSGFTCPECRGPLYERADAPHDFQCRVGHRFPLKTLLDEATETQERKLYEAIVALEEGADIAELAHARGLGNGDVLREAGQLREHAAAIRKLVENRYAPPLD